MDSKPDITCERPNNSTKPINYCAGIQRFVAVEVPFRESCLVLPVGGLFRAWGATEVKYNEFGDAVIGKM